MQKNQKPESKWISRSPRKKEVAKGRKPHGRRKGTQAELAGKEKASGRKGILCV